MTFYKSVEPIPDVMNAAARLRRIRKLHLHVYQELGPKMQSLLDQELEKAVQNWTQQTESLAQFVLTDQATLQDAVGEIYGAAEILTEEPEKI